MVSVRAELAGNPDRLRWNAKFRSGFGGSFEPHPLAGRALSLELPPGPVLDLACGPSGSALAAAAAGRAVLAVDASDAALELLADEASRRGLAELITLEHEDLTRWRPSPERFALVLCTGYWDLDLFPAGASAVLPGGLLGWEALTLAARSGQPNLPEQWCLGDGEPASLLPASWEVIEQVDVPGGNRRRLLAARPPG